MSIYVAVVWAYVAVCGYVEVCACVLMCVQYVHMLMQAKSVAMRICCFAKKQQQSHLQGQEHGPLRGYFEPTDWGQWCIGDDDRYAMIRKLPQNESTFAFQNHSVCIAHDIKPLSLNFQHLINLQKYPVSRYILEIGAPLSPVGRWSLLVPCGEEEKAGEEQSAAVCPFEP